MGRIIDRRRVMGGEKPPYDYKVQYLMSVPNPNIYNWTPQTEISSSKIRLDIDSTHYVTWEGRVLTESKSHHLITGVNDGFTHYVRFTEQGGIGNYGINITPIALNTLYDVRMYIDNTQIKVGVTIDDNYYEKTYKGFQGNSVNKGIIYGHYDNNSVIYIYPNKWYQNNVLVADLITVVKDGVACFYDKISGEFFKHTGSVAWTAGPRI